MAHVPPADHQPEQRVGRRTAHGHHLVVDAVYRTPRLTLMAAYTLSWNKRLFPDFYPGWYYDKFDNRHKANITARWRLSDKVTVFADWTMHSGNHITVPTQ